MSASQLLSCIILTTTAQPKAEQLVTSNLDLELQFLVVLELVLEGFFAVIEGGHGLDSPRFVLVVGYMAVQGARFHHILQRFAGFG